MAKERLKRLPVCGPPAAPAAAERAGSPEAAAYAASPAPAVASFRAFRGSLEAAGFFRRDALSEARALATVLGLYATAAFLAPAHPLAATGVLGLGMQQAGWLSHDYIHGRGPLCAALRCCGALLNGHSTEWWVAKHSAHHVWTNTYELDQDVTQEPFFFLEHPKETGRADAPTRKYQHLFGYPLYCITFWAWRIASIMDIYARKDAKEAALLALNAALMLTLYPVGVFFGGVTVAGFLVGALVSATHQSEGVTNDTRDFISAQFASTRDADASGVARWLWGGMDTQLEHHLFPSMPRYKYAALRPLLKEWAEMNGVEYRISDWKQIIKDNWATLRDAAREAPVVVA